MTAPAAFEDFVRSYQDMVYTTALRLLKDPASSEDVAQETFLKAWERFSEVRGYESPGGWLKTVAGNLALNRLTRERGRWQPLEDAPEPEDPAPAAATELEARGRRESLEAALAALPGHQRVPLILFHFHDLAYETIAEKLGVSVAKLKTDIFRGRQALRRALEEAAG